MAIIRYTFADGHTEAVEVTEEFKREYERIERQSHSNDEKFRWRARKRETSLEKLREEVGLDIPLRGAYKSCILRITKVK